MEMRDLRERGRRKKTEEKLKINISLGWRVEKFHCKTSITLEFGWQIIIIIVLVIFILMIKLMFILKCFSTIDFNA